MPKRLLTTEEAGEVLAVDARRVQALARTGRLPGVVRIGRQIRVDPQKLEEFIERGGQGLETAQAA